MSKVLIIANAEVVESKGAIITSPVTQTMINAFRQAIKQDNPKADVEIVATASLWSNPQHFKNRQDALICPLTIQLPEWFNFPNQKLYQDCRQVEQLRHWVKEKLGYTTNNTSYQTLGDLWLPVVLTSKGPIYAEVIREGEIPNFYQQPMDLDDKIRQPLYSLAHRLLEYLKAPPSVYLLQFSLLGKEVIFDRLWPFPAAAAIASIKVQNPNLYDCHWSCLNNQPVLDLFIPAQSTLVSR
ncbi:MAG: hypothetical protein WCO81_01770 [Cyanobacteriota bacterium ELA615]|jgi:hypothetical protein